MSAPDVFSLAQVPITSHAFSPDRRQVAVSLNSNEVTIFSRGGSEWQPTETLAEHDKTITAIDWAPNTNRIVTTSQDRNAYVWTRAPDPETGAQVWKPTLVLLRINRAATCVRWSPLEDKFAVGSGARAVAICSFDPENNWWVSRLLKKPLRSTVLAVDWHPNNVLLATGSADMKARVFSAYIKDVDKKPAASVWGEKLPFNTVCGEYGSPSGGWVHSVGFSPSGDILAFVSHDCSVSIVDPSGPAIQTIKINALPFVTLAWTAEDAFVVAGHDCEPILFSGQQVGGWAPAGSLDDPSAGRSGAGAGRSGVVGRLNSTAFNTFKNAAERGGGSSGAATGGETALSTVHQNTITNVRAYTGAPGAVSHVSTTGVDGKLVVWDVGNVSTSSALAAKLANLQLR